MGGKSTSHGAALDSKKQHSSGFDLYSWQGLTEVLRKGKESLHDQAAYAEFRNLVLQYAQQGGDAELRKKIDAIIETFPSNASDRGSSEREEANDKQEQKEEKRDPSHHGSTKDKGHERTNRPQASRERALTPSKERRAKPVFKTSTPEPTPPKSAGEPPTTLPTEPTEPGGGTLQQSPSSDSPTEQKDARPPSRPAHESKPQEQKKPQVPKTDAGFKTIEEHKRRISEIKRMVHEKIGNPATLVDSYNELGREYMMALLAALKATGPGGKESPDDAMLRLEDAFETLLGTPPTSSKNTAELKTKEAPPRETKKEVKQEARKEPEEKQERHEKKTATKDSKPTSDKELEKPLEDKDQTSRQATLASEKPPVAHSLPSKKSTPKKTTIQIKQRPENEEDSEDHKKKPELSPIHTLASLLIESETKEDKKDQERALHEIPPERVASSVQSDIQKGKKMPPPKPSETGFKSLDAERTSHTAAKQTELSSPEISEALDQLLQEWSLFKSSGILGIGPSGADHPLYKKLAPLSMAEVMAGRWEGSNRQVTKTIKEYVNAWRHEQGIAYNIQETFEHYLRRVVFRIRKRMRGTNQSA